ncbi:MAG: hypothetical protein KF729_26365 [Sandaracinaceae bacterium]|nr:hypothetical protein [Sandaracinaceae bacterium]
MTHLRFRRSFRLWTAAAALFAICAACTYSEGERAASGGACPEGEVCSGVTPDGLTFYGPLPGENQGSLDFLRAVAVGGTQVLQIGGPREAVRDASVVSSASWFLTVEGDAEATLGDRAIALRGVSPGESHVRVLAPGTAELLDRVLLRVARVASVDANVLDTGGVRAGMPASVVFRLFDEQGERLVDESMEITSEDVEHARVTWDCIDFDAPERAERVSFTVRAGHRRWTVEIPVVR